METNFTYLLYSGNILNMFDIQKCWNKISQEDRYLRFKIHCLTLDLLCTAVMGTIFFSVCFVLQISLLFRFKNQKQSFRGVLLKKRLWCRCFPVNFLKFLRTPFLQNTSERLLLVLEHLPMTTPGVQMIRYAFQ